MLNNEQDPHFGWPSEDKEVLARQVLLGLRTSLQNYIDHRIDYRAINLKNVVRRNKVDY